MRGPIQVGAVEAPLFDEGCAREAAQERLEALGLGDGLPLVAPTARCMERMLDGIADPSRAEGFVPPLFGALSAEAVAYCAVLAGCHRAELSVVHAALSACLEPDFNLLGIQTTTGTPTVALIVQGPAARRLGINAATNCLGPGTRANACIGRALRLCLVNIGGAHPGIGDMATMGQPGKYTFCLAERDDDATFPTLRTRFGLSAEQSAVTVLGVSGTLEVLPIGATAPDPAAVLEPLLAAMDGAQRASHAGRERPGGEQYFLLPPEVASYFARSGWTLADLRAAIGRDPRGPRLARSGADFQPVVTGGAGIKMTYLQPWGGGSLAVTRSLPE